MPCSLNVGGGGTGGELETAAAGNGGGVLDGGAETDSAGGAGEGSGWFAICFTGCLVTASPIKTPAPTTSKTASNGKSQPRPALDSDSTGGDGGPPGDGFGGDGLGDC